MKKINLTDGVLKIHFRCNDTVLKKALRNIELYLSNEIRPKTLSSSKKYKVLNITRDERIVIDGNTYHLMSHEKYNKFIDRKGF